MTEIIQPNSFSNPVMDAKIVQDIQALFGAELDWLQICYPIARIGITSRGQDQELVEYKYPQIYKNDGSENYIDVLPDSGLRSYCFFEVDSPYKENSAMDTNSIDLCIIFWINLKKLDPGRDYDYSRELASHAAKVLQESTGFASSISSSGITFEYSPERIFDKYSITQQDEQMMMYPYAAFKMSFTVDDYLDTGCKEDFIAEGGDDDCEPADPVIVPPANPAPSTFCERVENCLQDSSTIINIQNDITALQQSVVGNANVLLVDYISQMTIINFAPVTSNGFICDSNNIAHRGKLIGLATEGIFANFGTKAYAFGEVTNPFWSWTIGALIYLNGTVLSETPPDPNTSIYSQVVGTAVKPDTIDVLIQQSFGF